MATRTQKHAPLAEKAQRFRVLRPFSGLQPGDIVDASGWPFGRAANLVRQRYLLPLAEG